MSYLVVFTKAINLATLIKLLTHYAKGTLSLIITSAAYKITNSRSISLNVKNVLFQLFLHSTIRYR